MKKLAFTLIFYITTLLTNQSIFAQQSRWQFVGRSTNGSVSFLDTSDMQKNGNERQAWTKDVYPDGSYKMSRAQWQCREKRFRMRQIINYDDTGQVINTEKDIG